VSIRELTRGEWLPFFNKVSKEHPDYEVEVEVMGEEVGDQYSVEWAAWTGATYDDESDALDVFTSALTHTIPSPREIYVDDGNMGGMSFRVRDGAGNTQIIRLRTPAPHPNLPPGARP
jgi:hypothetical protein